MFAWKNHGRSLGRIDGWWSDLLPEWLIRVRYQWLGPQPSLANTRCQNTGQDTFVLDNASALIDGQREWPGLCCFTLPNPVAASPFLCANCGGRI